MNKPRARSRLSETIQLKRKLLDDQIKEASLVHSKPIHSIPMTSSNGNNSDRLNRIERILESTAQRQQETERIVESNSRAIQAMMEQRATDRLKREEEKAEHERRMARLEDLMASLVSIEQGQNRMLANIDETQPTMLRRLMAIENKVDTLIERDR